METIRSWLRHLFWEAGHGSSDGLTAALAIANSPREPMEPCELLLSASNIDEAVGMLRALARLGTVSRVVVTSIHDLSPGDQRLLWRVARQLRSSGLVLAPITAPRRYQPPRPSLAERAPR